VAVLVASAGLVIDLGARAAASSHHRARERTHEARVERSEKPTAAYFEVRRPRET
jgi:hypothetical protein